MAAALTDAETFLNASTLEDGAVDGANDSNTINEPENNFPTSDKEEEPASESDRTEEADQNDEVADSDVDSDEEYQNTDDDGKADPDNQDTDSDGPDDVLMHNPALPVQEGNGVVCVRDGNGQPVIDDGLNVYFVTPTPTIPYNPWSMTVSQLQPFDAGITTFLARCNRIRMNMHSTLSDETQDNFDRAESASSVLQAKRWAEQRAQS
jgi:hypothetical protein